MVANRTHNKNYYICCMPKEDEKNKGVNESTLKDNISTDKFNPEIKASIRQKKAQFVTSQTVTK